MSDKKIKLRGTIENKIKFSHKEEDESWTGWQKFNAENVRDVASKIGGASDAFYEYSRNIRFIFSIIAISIVILLLIGQFIFERIKKYTDYQITEETFFITIPAVIVISAVVIMYFIFIFKDRKEYGELERIRKFKPGQEPLEKKKTKSKKKIKEDTPWEM